jgi:hypothetical protein
MRRGPNSAKSSSPEHCPNIDRNCDTKVHTFGSGPEGHREVVLTLFYPVPTPNLRVSFIPKGFRTVFCPTFTLASGNREVGSASKRGIPPIDRAVTERRPSLEPLQHGPVGSMSLAGTEPQNRCVSPTNHLDKPVCTTCWSSSSAEE